MFGPIKRKNKDEDAEKIREQEETARVYAEFVRSFQSNDEEEEDPSTRFVKAGVIVPGSSDVSNEEGSSYMSFQSTKKTLWLPPSSLQNKAGPTSNFSSSIRTDLGKGIGGIVGITENFSVAPTQERPKVREIDLFLEEIKQKQESMDPKLRLQKDNKTAEEQEICNLYLGNLSTNVTEEFLYNQFSKFGTITSVKIMYPRTEEERSRRRYVGFVSFESHNQAKTAKLALDGIEYFGLPLRIGWGKTTPPANQAAAQQTLAKSLAKVPPAMIMNMQPGAQPYMNSQFLDSTNSLNMASPMIPHKFSSHMMPPHMMPMHMINPNFVNPSMMNSNMMNPNIMPSPMIHPNMMNPNMMIPNLMNSNTANPGMTHPSMIPPNMINNQFMQRPAGIPPHMMPPQVMPNMYPTPFSVPTAPPLFSIVFFFPSFQAKELSIVPTKEPPIHVNVTVDARQKLIIDLTAQYVKEVSQEGFAFEKLLRNRESGNKLFKFLEEPTSDNAIYYRWRIYSLAQGDTLRRWRTEPFVMFEGCRTWYPPGVEYQDDAMSAKFQADIAHRNRLIDVNYTKQLDDESREQFETILKNLTRERSSILQAMIFCLDHAECAAEISDFLLESLTNNDSSLDLKIARLYLVSDILHNASTVQQAAYTYRRCLERCLPAIFSHNNRTLQSLSGRITIQAMKDRVLKILRTWETWALYPPMYLKGLESSFLKDPKTLENLLGTTVTPLNESDATFDSAIDGNPMSEWSLLSNYPFWIRESVKEWNSLDLTCLENLCLRKGLCINPEISEDTQEEQSLTYAGMRQLLIRRLVENEVYWHSKQLQPAI